MTARTSAPAEPRARPIILSGPNVLATLARRKTQTRRAVHPQPPRGYDRHCWFDAPVYGWTREPEPAADWFKARCPYGLPGDRLWVKETWQSHEDPKTLIDGILYKADGVFVPIENTRAAAEHWADAAHLKPRPEDFSRVKGTRVTVAVGRKAKGWRSPIFMPRWTSRVTLEVTGVRVERLQEITEEDAFREGFACQGYYCDEAVGHVDCGGVRRFRESWDTLNGGRGFAWESNPWVWVVSYRVVDQAGEVRDGEV